MYIHSCQTYHDTSVLVPDSIIPELCSAVELQLIGLYQVQVLEAEGENIGKNTFSYNFSDNQTYIYKEWNLKLMVISSPSLIEAQRVSYNKDKDVPATEGE